MICYFIYKSSVLLASNGWAFPFLLVLLFDFLFFFLNNSSVPLNSVFICFICLIFQLMQTMLTYFPTIQIFLAIYPQALFYNFYKKSMVLYNFFWNVSESLVTINIINFFFPTITCNKKLVKRLHFLLIIRCDK